MKESPEMRGRPWRARLAWIVVLALLVGLSARAYLGPPPSEDFLVLRGRAMGTTYTTSEVPDEMRAECESARELLDAGIPVSIQVMSASSCRITYGVLVPR